MNYNNLIVARKKVAKIMKRDPRWYDLMSKKEITKEERYLRKTPKRCSCPMCGNPRKHFGQKTLQEMRSDINFTEQLEMT